MFPYLRLRLWECRATFPPQAAAPLSIHFFQSLLSPSYLEAFPKVVPCLLPVPAGGTSQPLCLSWQLGMGQGIGDGKQCSAEDFVGWVGLCFSAGDCVLVKPAILGDGHKMSARGCGNGSSPGAELKGRKSDSSLQVPLCPPLKLTTMLHLSPLSPHLCSQKSGF